MDLRKKKLLISALIASALNAGSVLMCEFVFKSVRAEVIASSVIGLLWIAFALIFCRKHGES